MRATADVLLDSNTLSASNQQCHVDLLSCLLLYVSGRIAIYCDPLKVSKSLWILKGSARRCENNAVNKSQHGHDAN